MACAMGPSVLIACLNIALRSALLLCSLFDLSFPRLDKFLHLAHSLQTVRAKGEGPAIGNTTSNTMLRSRLAKTACWPRILTGPKLWYSTQMAMTPEEKMITDKLQQELQPEACKVQDVSGGCGSMFAINVTSKKFNGLSLIKQHQLVNRILKEDISRWHGLQLTTKKVSVKNPGSS